jgi:type I restriction enzyme S subunit
MTEGWEERSLGDLASRLTVKNRGASDNVLTISARDGLINQEEYFNKSVASRNLDNYFVLQRGDFAYNKSHSADCPLGVVRRLERYDVGVVSPLYICFRASAEAVIEPDFLLHFFDGGGFDTDLRQIAKQGARDHGLLNVRASEFFEMRASIPPLVEQKKIAEILGSVDEAIQATQAVIDQTRKVKQGLLQQLLTRGIGHTRFKQTEIGEIPESWEVSTVGDACTIRNDLRKPIHRADRDAMPGPYPYYGPTKALSYMSEYRFEGSYALIGEDGDHFLKFDRWSMTQLVEGRFNVNNHAHAVESSDLCTAEWFYQFFRHRDITPRLTRQGAGRYKLKKATLVQLPIALPPRSEQLAIHEAVASFDRAEEAGQAELQSLMICKKATSADLLSGRVRVKVDA